MSNSDGTHNFEFRDGLAIAQIVCFAPSFLYAWDFRSAGRIGWFGIGVFSALRLVGASTRLASIHDGSSSLHTATFVCESMGIILLIFLYLEFMERINRAREIAPKFVFTLPSLLTLLDVGLSVGGYITMANRTENVLLPTGWTIASSALIAFVFVYVVGVFAWFWRARSTITTWEPEEHRLMRAAAVCTIPMIVRNIYPLIFVATSDMFWNQVRGNSYTYLFMILVPEVLVITVAIWCIRRVEPLPKKQGPKKTQWKSFLGYGIVRSRPQSQLTDLEPEPCLARSRETR